MIAHAPPPPAHIGQSHRRLPAIISHVVVVIQENPSIDNFFNGFCASEDQCAQTTMYDVETRRSLQSVDIVDGGPSHSHEMFETEYDNGNMDGFTRRIHTCRPRKRWHTDRCLARMAFSTTTFSRHLGIPPGAPIRGAPRGACGQKPSELSIRPVFPGRLRLCDAVSVQPRPSAHPRCM